MLEKSTSSTNAAINSVLLVIPVHNRSEDLRNLLKSLSLLNLKGTDLSIAIIDDASPSPMKSAIDPSLYSNFKNVYWFRNEQNQGPAISRNIASSADQSKYIWFLDSDTEITQPDCLQEMLAELNLSSNVGAVGGVIEADENGKKWLMQFDVLSNLTFFNRKCEITSYNPTLVDSISTSSLLLNRSNFEKIGKFDSKLVRDEDTDVILGLKRLGLRAYVKKEFTVWHRFSTAGRETGAFAHFKDSNRYLKDLLQSRIYLMAKYSAWKVPVLPLLDALCFGILFYRIKTGTYVVNRIRKAVPQTKIQVLSYFAATYLSTYLWGYKLILFGTKSANLTNRRALA